MKNSTEEWLQRFAELDLLGDDSPSGFSVESATKDPSIASLVAELQQAFGTADSGPDDTETVWIDQTVQDASYHTGILLKGWDPAAPSDRMEIRLSNFGRLACVSAIDDAEPNDAVFAFLAVAVGRAGYTLLDDGALRARWTDCHGKETNAWKRFFDYR